MSETKILDSYRIAYTQVTWLCSYCEMPNRSKTNMPGLMSARCGKCHRTGWIRVTDAMLRRGPPSTGGVGEKR